MAHYTLERDPPAAVLVGCAGWNIPGAAQESFPAEGSHLQRYAQVFPAVEINTSFYRPHRPASYTRWRDSVPPAFRFAVKVPREITHASRLRKADAALEKFIGEVAHLEQKLGCLLVQLPPSLRYDAPMATQFFHTLRVLTAVTVVCEPRHPTWFAPAAADMLMHLDIVYATADPPIASLPAAVRNTHTVYLRLHGSPLVYHSAYSEEYLDKLAGKIEGGANAGQRVWCIFDNTASGAAVPNALSLLSRLQSAGVIPAS